MPQTGRILRYLRVPFDLIGRLSVLTITTADAIMSRLGSIRRYVRLPLIFLVQLLVIVTIVAPVTYAIGQRIGLDNGLFAAVIGPISILILQRKLDISDTARTQLLIISGISFGIVMGAVSSIFKPSTLGFVISFGAFAFFFKAASEFATTYGLLEDENFEPRELGLLMAMQVAALPLITLLVVPVTLGIWYGLSLARHALIGAFPNTTVLHYIAVVLLFIFRIPSLIREILHIQTPLLLRLPHFHGLSGFAVLALATAAALTIAESLGVVVGETAAAITRKSLVRFAGAFPYLRAMFWPVIGFLLGFFAIMMWFAGIYASLRVRDSYAFYGGHTGKPSLGDFIFFSLMTLTTLGYSRLTPASPSAKAAVSIEGVIGLLWVVVVFAAVIAYLEPEFRQLQQRSRNGEEGTTHALEVLTNEVERLRADLIKDTQFKKWLGLASGRIARFRSRILTERKPKAPTSTATITLNVSLPYSAGKEGISKVTAVPENGVLSLQVIPNKFKLMFDAQDIRLSVGNDLPVMSAEGARRLANHPGRKCAGYRIAIPNPFDADDEPQVAHVISDGYLHIRVNDWSPTEQPQAHLYIEPPRWRFWASERAENLQGPGPVA